MGFKGVCRGKQVLLDNIQKQFIEIGDVYRIRKQADSYRFSFIPL